MQTPTTLLTILFLMVAQICFAQTEQQNTYTITASTIDPTLHKDSIRLKLKFTNEKGKAVTDNIMVEANGDTVYPTLDRKGACTILMPWRSPKSALHFFFKNGYMRYDLTTGAIVFERQSVTHINVQFETRFLPIDSMNVRLDKPVIYLYPTVPTEVDLRLGFKGELEFTYPAYKDGWKNVTAYPNGDLRHEGRSYRYLFWEGKLNLSELPAPMDEGFYVAKDSLVPFFEQHLALAGLSESEAQDFITFWVPKMMHHPMHLVRFIFTDVYDRLATLHITPKPDNVIRVFVVWNAVDATTIHPLKPQTFPSYTRSGFTVVEWGGSELTDLLKYAD